MTTGQSERVLAEVIADDDEELLGLRVEIAALQEQLSDKIEEVASDLVCVGGMP